MGYDALMRWEWEGGAPDSVSEQARARPAENTDIRSQPTKRRLRASRGEVDAGRRSTGAAGRARPPSHV